MAAKVGLKCGLFRNSATHGSPTWVEVALTKDLTLPFDKGEADSSSRGSTFATSLPTLKKTGVDGNMIRDTADAVYAAFRDSFLNDSELDLLVLDTNAVDGSSVPTGKGFRIVGHCYKFQNGEPLENVATIDFSIKPSGSYAPSVWPAA